MINQQSAARSTSSGKKHKIILQNYSNDVSCEFDEFRVNTHVCELRTSLFVSYVPTRPLQQMRQAPQQQQSTPSTQPILLQRVFSGKRTTSRCDTGTNACHWLLPWIPPTTTYDLRVAQLNNRNDFSPCLLCRQCIPRFIRPPPAISQTKSVCYTGV